MQVVGSKCFCSVTSRRFHYPHKRVYFQVVGDNTHTVKCHQGARTAQPSRSVVILEMRLAKKAPCLSKSYPFRCSSLNLACSLADWWTLFRMDKQCTGAARNDLTGMSEKQLDKGRKGWTSKGHPLKDNCAR